MKKLATILAVVVLSMTLFSCEKENQDCNCGYITDDGIETVNSEHFYWIEIRNDCSGNIGKFYLTYGDWLNAHPGSDFCLYNTPEWKVGFTSDNTVKEMEQVKEELLKL